MSVYLIPDKEYAVNGVFIKEYFLTKHNQNKISLPGKRVLPLAGVTIHNTSWISVNAATTAAALNGRTEIK